MNATDSPYTSQRGRRFALTLAAAFALVAAVVFWRGRDTPALVIGGISAVLLVAGVAVPARLGPVERAWMGFARAISRVTTPIFMGIVYFVVLTPAGWVRRTFGSNPIAHTGEAGTYWASRPRRDAETSRRRMERQF
ncbi:MAG: SxtJ family membrane protein [Gemmatimonadaceae bacterium]